MRNHALPEGHAVDPYDQAFANPTRLLNAMHAAHTRTAIASRQPPRQRGGQQCGRAHCRQRHRDESDRAVGPWGASIRSSRCSELVFVDQPAQPVPATNALSCRRRWRTHNARARRSKVAAAMRPGVVVVLDVLGDHADEVPFAADQEPVQALGARAGHPSLGVRIRVRRCDRGPDDVGAVSGEHGVEAGDELGVPVADEGTVARARPAPATSTAPGPAESSTARSDGL